MIRRIVGLLVVLTVIAGGAMVYLWLSFIQLVVPLETVVFAGRDGTSLVGDLYLPEAQVPHAAVVILHGSGPEVATEISHRLHTKAFTREGFAVLVYDKRGAGRSQGDFDAATFQDFITDGLAAVEYIRTRSDIDANKIGLFGLSQGAWFTPENAVRDGNVRFIVNLVMPVTNWAETVIFESENDLRRSGADDETISNAAELRRRIWAYYRDSGAANDPLLVRRAELEGEIGAAREEDWYRI